MNVCDRCRKPLKIGLDRFEISCTHWRYDNEKREVGKGNPKIQMDVCKDCFKRIVKTIKGEKKRDVV